MIYFNILKNNNYSEKNKIGFRAKVTNCWRKMIFVNHVNYLESIKKYNIPITPKTQIEIPNFRNGAHLETNFDDYSYVNVFSAILEGIGFHRDMENDFFDIMKVAMKNVDLRNK